MKGADRLPMIELRSLFSITTTATRADGLRLTGPVDGGAADEPQALSASVRRASSALGRIEHGGHVARLYPQPLGVGGPAVRQQRDLHQLCLVPRHRRLGL